MVDPAFFYATSTQTDQTGKRHGAPSTNHLNSVVDGSNAEFQRIQARVIEHLIQNYDVIVYIATPLNSPTPMIYARRSGGALIDSGVAGTDDTRVIQSAFSADGTTDTKPHTVIVIKPGLYKITSPNPQIPPNSTVIGYGVTFQSQTARVNILRIRNSAANVRVFGMTLDFNQIGFVFAADGSPPPTDPKPGTGPVKDILVQDCKFIRGYVRPEGQTFSSRMLFFRYNRVDTNDPLTAHNENIRVVNCYFNGDGMNDTYGVLQFMNTRRFLVHGCIFEDIQDPKSAALFLYYDNVSGIISNNQFYNIATEGLGNPNVAGDMADISTSGDTDITIVGNEIANKVQIRDCEHVNVVGNKIKRVEIKDWDLDINVDGNQSQYRGSRHLLIAGNTFNTFPELPTEEVETRAAVDFDLRNNLSNPVKGVAIVGNEARVERHLVRFTGVQNTATIPAAQDVLIANNIITERTDTANSDGIVDIQGNSSAPSHGYRNIFVNGNFFASTGSTTPKDIRLTTTGMENIVARGNWFNNGGVRGSANAVVMNSYPYISGNFGLSDLTRDTNSGTATIASDSTTITVTHGVAYTPNPQDIQVTPTNFMGAATKFRHTNLTATTFTIEVNAAPGGTDTATFAWKVARSV